MRTKRNVAVVRLYGGSAVFGALSVATFVAVTRNATWDLLVSLFAVVAGCACAALWNYLRHRLLAETAPVVTGEVVGVDPDDSSLRLVIAFSWAGESFRTYTLDRADAAPSGGWVGHPIDVYVNIETPSASVAAPNMHWLPVTALEEKSVAAEPAPLQH